MGVGARRAAERAIFTLSTAQGPARAHPHAYPPETHKDRPKGARLRALIPVGLRSDTTIAETKNLMEATILTW